MAQKKLESTELLRETEIDFYHEEEASFHIISGRDWEPDNPNAIDTTPCPTIKFYKQRDDLYDVLVTLPSGVPIIMDWIQQEPNEGSFLRKLIRGLDEGYEGIDSIDSFKGDNEEVKQEVQKALGEIVPMHI